MRLVFSPYTLCSLLLYLSSLFIFLKIVQDEDNINILNAMSDPTSETLDNLKFYAVPASWLVKVWPILSYRPDLDSLNNVPEKDVVGKILNAQLVAEDARLVTDEDDNDKRKPAAVGRNAGSNSNSNTTNFDQAKASMERFHRRQMTQRAKTTKLMPGLQHAKDYFFLGARVWDLVKLKFGYDGYEICRTSCKATATTGTREEEQGTIAITLLPGEGTQPAGAVTMTTCDKVVIPATGRFPYEKILPTLMINDDSGRGLDSMMDEKNNSVVSVP
jgi:hypothetical protein